MYLRESFQALSLFLIRTSLVPELQRTKLTYEEITESNNSSEYALFFSLALLERRD